MVDVYLKTRQDCLDNRPKGQIGASWRLSPLLKRDFANHTPRLYWRRVVFYSAGKWTFRHIPLPKGKLRYPKTIFEKYAESEIELGLADDIESHMMEYRRLAEHLAKFIIETGRLENLMRELGMIEPHQLSSFQGANIELNWSIASMDYARIIMFSGYEVLYEDFRQLQFRMRRFHSGLMEKSGVRRKSDIAKITPQAGYDEHSCVFRAIVTAHSV
jgi:relaxasome component MobI-like protein